MLKIPFVVFTLCVLVSAGTQENVAVPTPGAVAPALSNSDKIILPEVPQTGATEQKPSETKKLEDNVEVKAPETKKAEAVPLMEKDTATVTPKPTTQKPTTTTPHTTTEQTTTTKPTTTTVAPVTTTAAPVPPVPPATAGKWIVNETSVICILAQMALRFNVTYLNTSNAAVHKVFNVPANATASGNCGKTEQELALSWQTNNVTINNLTFHFVLNDTDKHYSLHHLELVLPAADLPGYNSSVKSMTWVHEAPSFSAGLTNSYRCKKHQTLNLKVNGMNDTMGYLTVSDLQFQAFRTENSTIFGLAKDCAFDTPDAVPIVVGCALAGLVVIVLIAYLAARRRSQARGYLSM